MTKTGRRYSSRTMWQVLADGLATGLADDLEAWAEYERASHTRQQVTYRRGLGRRYRLAEEETDEEIAETDVGYDDLIALPAETWTVIRGCAEELLTAPRSTASAVRRCGSRLAGGRGQGVGRCNGNGQPTENGSAQPFKRPVGARPRGRGRA